MKLLYAEDERAMSEAVVDILTYHNYILSYTTLSATLTATPAR
ncbi:hypothetical protein [Merdimmobilis hominis]|nr:hypothetical protein [Merdimmobilis hominis]